jgi:hypothetical protein
MFSVKPLALFLVAFFIIIGIHTIHNQIDKCDPLGTELEYKEPMNRFRCPCTRSHADVIDFLESIPELLKHLKIRALILIFL